MFGRLNRKLLRLSVPFIITMSLLILPVMAQSSRVLEPGSSVAGVLDADAIAQVYTFAGGLGDVISLTVTNENDSGLALLLTNSSGDTIAQSSESGSPTELTDVTLPATGAYFVTVLAAPGVTLPADSTFDLAFQSVPADEASATAEVFAPGQILSVNGLQVTLTWNSLANMDLEVRDPVGGNVFFSRPTAPSGGQFGVNVNSVCETRTADAPTERAVWPAGAVPTGSYEMLVYYQPLDNCSTSDPVSFTLSAQLDDETIDSIEGNLLPNETFVSSFFINPDGTLVGRAGGLYTDPTVLPVSAAELEAAALPITRDQNVSGLLTSGDYFDVYTFTGQANELVTVNLSATSGSLDTLLLLLDESGNVIGSSDDLLPGEVTDSSLQNFRLFSDATYTIVATRYGKEVGGTEGNYSLLLTGPSGDLPQEVLDLGLPRGDLEIALSWNTNADLQLLVRDPRGDSVFDDTPQVPSGGRLAASGNINCTVGQTSPVSYVYWPEGTLTPGLYEVEVWYQNPCNDARIVNFALNILFNGAPIFTETAQPVNGQVFLTSFVIGLDEQVQIAEGGFIGTRQQGVQQLDVSSLDFRAGLATAEEVFSGQAVSGSITNTDKFDLYTFEGQAGDVVTISMIATAGRLDTVLFLLDPNGFQIVDNDDAVVGESTDSLISEYVLPEDGRYTIVATHFGMQYGGTTGAYNLTFSRLN